MDTQVSILSFNVCLSIGPPFRFNGCFSRSNKVADSIYEHTHALELDIICLQELVINRSKVLKSLIHHPFSTDVACGSWLSSNIRFIQSGLAIVSRWPILDQRYHIFTGKSYHYEAYMSKAVQYAKIQAQNKYNVHIFNTHTQAWTNSAAQQIRLEQFRQIAEFIKSLNIPPSEPVIICGDFNLDFYESAYVLREFESIADLKFHLPNVPQFSFDPTINPLVGTDDIDEYRSSSYKNGCFDEFMNTGLCCCCPKQLLDGIATSNIHLKPISSTSNVIQNKLSKPFEMFINVSTLRNCSFASDHFPILSAFTFNLQESPLVDQPLLECSEKWDYKWILVELVIFAILYLALVSTCYHIFKIRK